MWPDIFEYRRHGAVLGLVLGLWLTVAAGSAAGQVLGPPHAAILDAGMVGQSLRIVIATAGLNESQGDPASVAVSAWLDGVPIRAELPLIHMPSRFAMDLDLAAGVVRVGGVSVGRFAPVPRFRENLRFPIQVSVQRGALVATAGYTATILLPTVIVPGYLNELDGPSREVMSAFRRHGYIDAGAAQNVFWFSYPSA